MLFWSIPLSLWAQSRLVIPYTDTTNSCSFILSTLVCIRCVPGPGREHRQKTHVLEGDRAMEEEQDGLWGAYSLSGRGRQSRPPLKKETFEKSLEGVEGGSPVGNWGKVFQSEE